MKIIYDSSDRAYELAITIKNYRQVKQDTGIDLALINAPGPSGQPLIADLHNSTLVLLDVLWSLVRVKAQKNKVSRDEFDAAFYGPKFADARQAFIEELELFFQTQGRVEEAAEILAVPEAERASLARILDNLKAGSSTGEPTTLSRSGAESSASSTPAHSPSAS